MSANATLVLAALALGSTLILTGCAHRRPVPGPPTQARLTRAEITIKTGTTDTCEQTVGGQPVDHPHLSKSGLDTIQWVGSTAISSPRVTFPIGQSPFRASTLSGGQNSGTVTGAINRDFDFQSVTVFPFPSHPVVCRNPGAMGVHIDR
jgi:hypothetical protein